MEDHGYMECERQQCKALGEVRHVRVAATGHYTSDFALWCLQCCGAWARACAVCEEAFDYQITADRADLCCWCREKAVAKAAEIGGCL